MRENSSLASMARFVDAAVGVEGVLCWWKYRVELRFLDVGFIAVDGL
jgi:hypothetical protein